jgi:phosphatidate phosphatase PAH1
MNSQTSNVTIKVNDILFPENMQIDNSGACYFDLEGKKSIRLSSKYLEKMELKNGSNTIQFSVSTCCNSQISIINAKIFLYNYNDKFIISDVDGTITRSDILGHVCSVLGYEWVHQDIR